MLGSSMASLATEPTKICGYRRVASRHDCSSGWAVDLFIY